MKKFFVFLVFALSIVLFGTSKNAEASSIEEYMQIAEERVSAKATLEGIVLSEYPYTFVEYYEADPAKHVKYVDVVFSKYPLVRYDYGSHGGSVELDAVLPNNFILGQHGIELAQTGDCFYYTYNANLDEVYSRTNNYGKTRAFTGLENYYFNVTSETSHNVVDCDSGDVIFHGAPVPATCKTEISLEMSATEINITVPLNVLCNINPNEDEPFTYGDLVITNNSFVPVKVSLGMFEQESSDKTMLFPDGLGDVSAWDSLNSEESARYFSLGIKPDTESNWDMVTATDYAYADNLPVPVILGTIHGGNSANLTMKSYHGRSFKDTDTLKFRLGFIAELALD